MGQEERGVPEAAALSADASLGRYLARQRRLRGISLDELSDRTRIPLRSLERLEAGAFDLQADGFSRSFVRTVAGALGLDPDEAVTRLLPEPGAPDEAAGRAPRPGGATLRHLALGALAVAAGALVLALWGWLSGPPEPPGEPERSELVTRRDAVRALAERERAERP